MDWISSVEEVLRYIEAHIEEPLTAEALAHQVFASSHHFQRVFSLLTGMPLSEYIRNRRLSIAGVMLSRQDVKVIDLALQYGYESPESFSKAFTRFHGVTPQNAKKEGAALRYFAPLVIKITLEGGSFMDYKIEKKEAFDVLAMTRTFSEQTSTVEIPKFWTDFMQAGHSQVVCGVFGMCHGLSEGQFQYSIADPYTAGSEVPEGFEVIQVPAYTWAMFTCVGPMPNAIQEMWKRVYSEWLPNSNYELVPGFDIEMYTAGDIHSADYISEIWIPVQQK